MKLKPAVPYFFLIVLIAFSSCRKEWEYKFLEKVENKYTVDSEGKEANNDTVMIVLPISPPFKFFEDESEDEFGEINEYVENMPYKIVTPIFYEHLDKSLSEEYYLSDSEAMRVIDISINIVQDIIDEFKNEGKFVVVVGELYGFYYGLQLLNTNKIMADKYVFVGVKLSIDDKIVSGLSNYKLAFIDNSGNISESKYIVPKRLWSALKIFSNLLSYNYLQILIDNDAINKSNVLFIVEDFSMFGKLSKNEIDFYNDANINSIFEESSENDKLVSALRFLRSR